MLSLAEARAKVFENAEPGEPIEVALPEALGLVLAEPLTSDVDLPPFDRAGFDGYAVRSADATTGARLRVVNLGRKGRSGSRGSAEVVLDPGEAVHVLRDDPLPVHADAVVRTEDSQPESGLGPPREVLVLRGVEPGQGVVPRGYYLRAGVTLAEAGTSVRPPLVGLLASQGCVHPVCHRRVRVAVFAVGDHLVNPGDAPVMHRERNAAGPTVVAPCLQLGATAHDLGTISERALPATLDRALTAPVVVVLGEPDGAIPRALKRAGVEMEFLGVSLHPGKRLNYGVLRDGDGRAAHHVFHMAPGPVGVLTGMTLLVAPLIARLQGGPAEAPWLRAAWSGPPHRPTDDRLWAVPVTLHLDETARLRATPIDHRGRDDLLSFAHAEAFALLPERSGPWNPGDVVDIALLGNGGFNCRTPSAH